MRIFRNMLLILIAAILTGTALMISVYMLPTEPIRRHLIQTPERLIPSSDKASWLDFPLGTPYSVSDGGTDSIMLKTAAYKSPHSPAYSAMMNTRLDFTIAGEDLIRRDTAAGQSLRMAIDDNNTGGEPQDYSRYWHGYLVYLKPLLTFLTVPAIRLLNFVIQFILLFMVILKINDVLNKKYAFAFLITILVIDPVAAALCFQYCGLYNIKLVTILIMLYKNETLKNNGKYYILFMLAGILTSFIDLLSYPLATYGIPAVMYVLLNQDAKNLTLKIIKFGFAWIMGYFGMWFGKWLMAWGITGYNTFANAVDYAFIHLSHNPVIAEANSSVLNAMNVWDYANWKWAFERLNEYQGIWVFITIFGVIMILFTIFMIRAVLKNKIRLSNITSLLILSVSPFVWYAAFEKHTIIHYFMTYKIIAITIFAFTSIAVICSDSHKV